MKKHRGALTLFLWLSFFIFLWAAGCTPALPPEEGEGTLEIVDSVPDELLHNFSHELAQDKGARVFNLSHDGYTYHVATPGRQSVKGGEITILEMDGESDTVVLRLEYIYPGVTERSVNTHFLIARVPEGKSFNISIAAATGVAE